MGERAVLQQWQPASVLSSYVISVTGSYCTIQLMEHWRLQEDAKSKHILLVLSSITLGGCAIWCTHFTGMSALSLVLDDGTILAVNFELGLTLLSFLLPTFGVWVGLRIASTDPFFLEMQATRRRDMMAQTLSTMKMTALVNRDQVSRKIKITALCSRLHRISIGGLFAAFSVLCMHYLGMKAQRMSASMHFHGEIVFLSAIIAIVTANAAFWILFRVLTFMPKHQSLRFASALIMGAAACGTHYTGMASCHYAFTTESYAETASMIIDGPKAANFSSHVALLLCYWFVTYSFAWHLQGAGSGGGNNSTHDSNNNAGPAGRYYHAAPHQNANKAKAVSSTKQFSNKKIGASSVGALFTSTVVETDGDPVESINGTQ